jgi:Protein of unknown function (DUF4236)
MAFGYRKRKKIGPGLFLNFSKREVGVRAGRRERERERTRSDAALARLEGLLLA